ncbi:MAG: hypothetical protein QM764_04545 [Chitinophagaceae bacterium]
MKLKGVLLILAVWILISCHKESDNPPPAPVNPNSFVALKLKDISRGIFPSPYYHFEYRDDKYIAVFNFSNGLNYDMTYNGDNLTLMKNNTEGTTKDSIKYHYTGHQLTHIIVTTGNGTTYRRAFLSYYNSGQLKELEWELLVDNGVFAREQSFSFSYYPDGNVKEIVQDYFAIGQLPATSFTDRYENYDHKKNADGFTLVEPSRFNVPILVPGITLQMNNPGRVVRSGGATPTFEANYNYTYDANDRPLVKIGDFVHTSGPDAGQHYQLQTTFSYYN